MLPLFLWMTAQAAPVLGTTPDGWVRAQIPVDAPIEAVEAVLRDVPALDELSGDIRATRLVPDGDCVLVDREVVGVLSPWAVRTRRCPTGDGFEEALVESSDFRTFAARWRLEPDGQGTLLTYEVTSSPVFPLPSGLVHMRIRAAARAIVSAVARVAGSCTMETT